MVHLFHSPSQSTRHQSRLQVYSAFHTEIVGNALGEATDRPFHRNIPAHSLFISLCLSSSLIPLRLLSARDHPPLLWQVFFTPSASSPASSSSVIMPSPFRFSFHFSLPSNSKFLASGCDKAHCLSLISLKSSYSLLNPISFQSIWLPLLF